MKKYGKAFLRIAVLVLTIVLVTSANLRIQTVNPFVTWGVGQYAVADNYLVAAPTNYSARLDVTSQSYKAQGDGKADDTQAIQNALNKAKALGGGIVYLPEGIYKTTRNLYVYSGTKLLGERASIVKVSGKNDSAVLAIPPNQKDVVLEGVRIYNKQASSNMGIDMQGNVKNVWVLNNSFQGERSQAININAPGIEHVQISGNHFEKVVYGLLSNQKSKDISDVRIVNNQFIDIYSDAIELNHSGATDASGDQVIIANNYISVPKGVGKSAGAGFGIGMAGAMNVTIIGNIIEKARYEAIHIEDGSKHITVVGNIINGVDNSPDNGLNSGVYIIDSDHVTVSNNSIYKAHNYGVHLEYAQNKQATNMIISGNTITDNGSGGIRIAGYSGDSNIIVSQNLITGNKGDGIRLDGEIRDLKMTDNIVKQNTGYGLFLKKSGLGWSITGNSFYGNGKDDIGYGPDYSFPVPIKDQSTVVTVTPEAGSTLTPWTDALSLGKGAEGTLYVTAKWGSWYSVKMYQITWNGSDLKATLLSRDAKGGLDLTTPRMYGNKLQVQVYTEKKEKIAIDVQFEGITMMK